MTTDYTITTKEKVKALLNITEADFDDLLDALIREVTAFFETYCARRFIATDYVKIYDSDNKFLFLGDYPINTFTKVEYSNGQLPTPTWTEYSNTSYYIYMPEGYLRFLADLGKRLQYLRATYNAGYLIDFDNETNETKHTLPFDITRVANQLVSRIYEKRLSAGKTSESIEGQSVSWSNAMTQEEKTVLDKYQANNL